MISCALYEEFWIKYVNWMKTRERDLKDESEKSAVVAKIRDIFRRASLHLQDKVRLHLEKSAFEESHGNFQEAIAILDRVMYNYPQLMSLKLKRINAERRQGNTATVHTLYKGCIDEAESVKVRSEWCLKYARYLKLSCGDDLKGINLLAEAVAIDEDNAKLRLLYIDSLLQLKPFDKSKIVEALDCAINDRKFDCHQRHLFAKRKVAFVEEFGDDVNQVLAAEEVCEAIGVEIESTAYHHHHASGEHADQDGSGASKQSNGTGYDATNSASYSAQHASSYQQYGARYGYPGYSSYPGNYYGGGGYQGYGQY
jgi:pre-mRNA-processing factor 39